MNQVFVMPYRRDSTERERNKDYVLSHLPPGSFSWHGSDLLHPPRPFSRARAIMQAWSDVCGSWPGIAYGTDVVTILDSDVYLPPEMHLEAAELALQTNQLVFPYKQLVHLDPAQTELFVEGASSYEDQVTKDPYEYPGGAVTVSRRLWDDSRGMDPRFEGWGKDDDAFLHVCHVLGGNAHHRLDHHAIHLFHPAFPDQRDPALIAANDRLLSEYHRRCTDSNKTRAYLNEVRSI